MKLPSPDPFLKLNSEEVNLQVPELNIVGYLSSRVPPDVDIDIQSSDDTNDDSGGYFQLISTFEINIPDDFVATSTPHLIREDGLQDDVALNLSTKSSKDSFDGDSLNDSAEPRLPELNKTYTKEDLKDLLECSPVKSYQVNTAKNLEVLNGGTEPLFNIKSIEPQVMCHDKDLRFIFTKKKSLLTEKPNAICKTNKYDTNNKKTSKYSLDSSNTKNPYLLTPKPNPVLESSEESEPLLINLDFKGSSNKLVVRTPSKGNSAFLKLTVTYSTCKKSIPCQDVWETDFQYCSSWGFLVKELTIHFFYLQYFQTGNTINHVLRQKEGLYFGNKRVLVLLHPYNSKISIPILKAQNEYFTDSKSLMYHWSDSVESNHSNNTDTHKAELKSLLPGNETVVENNSLPTMIIDDCSNKISTLSVAGKQSSWSENCQVQPFLARFSSYDGTQFLEYKSGLYWDYYDLDKYLINYLYSKESPDSKQTPFDKIDASNYTKNMCIPYEIISVNGSSIKSNCDDVFVNGSLDQEAQSLRDGNVDKVSLSFSGSTDSNFSGFQHEGEFTDYPRIIDTINLTKLDSRFQMEPNYDGINKTSSLVSELIMVQKQHSSVR